MVIQNQALVSFLSFIPPIFLRYMNYAGCLRKFDVEGFCARYPAAIAAAKRVQAAQSPQGEGPIPMKAAAAAITGGGGGDGGEGGEGKATGKGKGKAKKL